MNRFSFVVLAGAVLTLSACDGSGSDPATPQADADKPPVMQPASPAPAAADLAATVIPASVLADAQPLPGHCYLDKVNGEIEQGGFEVDAGESIRMVGWAVTADKAAPSDMIFVLQGEPSYGLPGTIGGTRPDVAKAMHSEAATESGVAVTTTLAGVTPGRYQVMALVGAAGQPQTLCDMSRYLQVSG